MKIIPALWDYLQRSLDVLSDYYDSYMGQSPLHDTVSFSNQTNHLPTWYYVLKPSQISYVLYQLVDQIIHFYQKIPSYRDVVMKYLINAIFFHHSYTIRNEMQSNLIKHFNNSRNSRSVNPPYPYIPPLGKSFEVISSPANDGHTQGCHTKAITKLVMISIIFETVIQKYATDASLLLTLRRSTLMR
jgi:hypothetical protein